MQPVIFRGKSHTANNLIYTAETIGQKLNVGYILWYAEKWLVP